MPVRTTKRRPPENEFRETCRENPVEIPPGGLGVVGEVEGFNSDLARE
jgi:hypothetical protein